MLTKQKARFALSSQQTWSGKDGQFNYEDFAANLRQVFEADEAWARSTIRWWNRYVVISGAYYNY